MPLNIVEYQYLAKDQGGFSIATPVEPSAAGQQVTVGQESAAFSGVTNFLRLHAEEDVRLAFGKTPSASSSSPYRMLAGQTEFVGVKPGHKLDTAAG